MARPRVSDSRTHDAAVFRIEQSILRELATKQQHLLDTAARLVARRLAPFDSRAARTLLSEIRLGELP